MSVSSLIIKEFFTYTGAYNCLEAQHRSEWRAVRGADDEDKMIILFYVRYIKSRRLKNIL